MLVTVRHLSKDTFLKVNNIYDTKELVEVVEDQLRHNNLIRVADIETNEEDLEKVLNEAYGLTNSIDEAWYENKNISIPDITRDSCRSTSIGDVIQIFGDSYMVDRVGFKILKKM